VRDQGDGPGAGVVLGIVPLGLVGGGGGLFALYRRRSKRQPDEPGIVEDPPFVPRLESLADPLLEAIASSARADGRRGGSKKPLLDDEEPSPAWVKRLDAEINVLADLRAAPSPPPHDRTAATVGDQSLSA
jgi:hypothetical protein